MNKEQTLEKLKELVLVLRDRSGDFRKDPQLAEEWLKKEREVTKSLKSMNSCDVSSLNDEYGAWFKKEIQPHIDKLDPELRAKLKG